MADLIQIATTIENINREIGKYRRQLKDLGKAWADAICDYDKKIAISLATLGDSETYELAGRTYKSPPVTVREKIAKGIGCEERRAEKLAETGYKSCVTNIEALRAQLNGNQSLFRYLDSTGNG